MASPTSQPVVASEAALSHSFRRGGIGARILALILLFGLEAVVATIRLDGATAVPPGAWLTSLVHIWGPWAARCVIGFAALFVTFAFLRYRVELGLISSRLVRTPVNWVLLAGHFVAIALFASLSEGVYGGASTAFTSNLTSAIWIVASATAIACAGFAFLPFPYAKELLQATGWLWAFAATASVVACSAATWSRSLWGPASRLAFGMVQFFLGLFVSDLVVQPAAFRIGTHRFTVVIADQCSGLEGISLFLMFGVVWLVLFRDEIRFPQALMILPIGALTLFVLNAVRITALVLIGNAGAREIASGGFHSQAGWIMFNLVSFGLAVSARHLPWISNVRHHEALPESSTANLTAAYLAPFLCILAAGMISRAASGSFEWLYPLRFFAALAAFWIYRRNYAGLDWRFGWMAPVTGVVIFATWVGLDRVIGTHGLGAATPAALAASPAAARLCWLTLRVLGGVITVPIAEELAFRGYLLRRLVSEDFTSGWPRTLAFFPIVISSVAFGLMHGDRWLAAIVAGLAYALVSVWRGRIGDATVAHATTNLLLAGYVLGLQQWQLW